jgi:hypothetical protein
MADAKLRDEQWLRAQADAEDRCPSVTAGYMPELHPLERKTREAQPKLGDGHYSKCLPTWIARCCDKFNDPNGIAFDMYDTNALAHTLIAARVRNEKMAAEIQRLREALRDMLDATVCPELATSQMREIRALAQEASER